MSLIHRIFGHSDAGLLCGRCEKPLEGHSEADCARKLSRRWFLGATLGAVAGAVVAPPLPSHLLSVDGFNGSILRTGNRLTLNFKGTLSELSKLCITMENPATGKHHVVEHTVDPLIERETFYVAPQAMKVMDVHWMFATTGSLPGKPVLLVRG